MQLKARNEFKYIGKPQQRLDTPAKVDGSAQFGIDVRLPGMLYAALAQPPELGASVKSFKADAAQGMPGVRQVLQTSSGVAVVADSWWQAQPGARCAADRVGAGREREADERLDQRGPEIGRERQGQGGAQGRRRRTRR